MFLKIVNIILDIPNIVDIPRVRTSTYGKNSFKYAAAVLWNDLPDDFRKISNFNQFKNILKSWNGNVCKCSACADLNLFKFLPSRSYPVFIYCAYKIFMLCS